MWKKYFYYTLILFLLFYGTGCKKEKVDTESLASLKIVNTVTGGIPVLLNNYFYKIPNNQDYNFTLRIGSQDIYVWPEADSLHPYFISSKPLMVNKSDIYTLFIGGTPVSPEGILIKEELPYRSDSTAGIRFINLSPNSQPVNVAFSVSPDVNQFENISYKEITEFKSFAATSANTSYTFEVRDPASMNVLASITMSGAALTNAVPRFRNVTLVFHGMVGGSPLPGIARVNHY